MFDLPYNAQQVRLQSTTPPSMLLELKRLFDRVKFGPNTLWVPQWFYTYLNKDEAANLVFKFTFEDLTLHVVQGLQVVVLAHCTEPTPHMFIGYPTDFNKDLPESCLYVRLSTALKAKELLNK